MIFSNLENIEKEKRDNQKVVSLLFDSLNRSKMDFSLSSVSNVLVDDFYKAGTVPYTGSNGEYIAYDLNGNIVNLIRTTADAFNNPVDMDILNYTYQNGNNNSNRLLKVTDDATTGASAGFNNGSSGNSNDYTYDANGNMLSDLNKGITSIDYNYLNLPELITFGNGNTIEYLYNAMGQKVHKTVNQVYPTTNTPQVLTDYLDGFQYVGGMLNFFPTAEGYVRATSITSDPADPQLVFNYVYNYTDHLGNIRLSYTKDLVSNELKILEENNYYPFGLKFQSAESSVLKDMKKDEEEQNVARPGVVISSPYNYKYNGMELQDELGLNWYDYMARNYDPALGRWFNIDPAAEISRRNSPYVYALNNPVFFIDPDGMVATPPDDIYLNRNGKEIYRVKNDQPDRTFIVQTSTKTHNKASSGLANTNPISAKDAKGTEKQIKAGNLEGDHMSNLIQIENADTQQQMLDVVNKDDGLGTEIIIENGAIQNMEAYKSDNFTEHGGNLENGQVVNVRDGAPSLPGYSSDGKAHLDSGVDFHDHPSGQVKVINSDGSYTTHGTHGFTTSDDVSWANGKTKYQFDMTGKKVNVYNSTGVIATIPFANFGKK